MDALHYELSRNLVHLFMAAAVGSFLGLCGYMVQWNADYQVGSRTTSLQIERLARDVQEIEGNLDTHEDAGAHSRADERILSLQGEMARLKDRIKENRE